METYQTESSAKIRPPQSVQGRHSRVILVAEDDHEMRRLLEWRLRRDGYEVQSCANGFELLGHIDSLSERDSPRLDLIVSDIRMPGFTGIEILEYVNFNGGGPPIVLITAFGDDDTRAKAEQYNAAAILDKPFDLDEFAVVVRRILDAAESLPERKQPIADPANNSGRFPLDIIFHRYPRLDDYESCVKEASRVLTPYQSDILSCRIVIEGNGPSHVVAGRSAPLDGPSVLEIRGIVVVPCKIFSVGSGKLNHEKAENFRTAVDMIFAKLRGRMREYYRDFPPTRSADDNTRAN